MAQQDKGRDDATPERTSAQQAASSGSLRASFPGQFRPTAEEFDRLWEDGMFVVDTNVLRHLYRYSRSTRDELLTVLRAVESQLFLPHQVAQEFLDGRLSTISTQREKLSALRDRVTGIREYMKQELRKVLRLRSGEDFPAALREALEEVPSSGYLQLSARLEALEKDLPRASNNPEDDEVWAAIEVLFEGRLGPEYQEEKLREAEEEAARRRTNKIPPGFKDERAGDFLIWRQTIDEAKRRSTPVVLITDDRKEDWWWRVEGTTIGPRPELIAELRKEAGVLFYMYTPDRLMSEARRRLNVEVSDESISEAEGFGRQTGDDVSSKRWSTLRAHTLAHLLTNIYDRDDVRNQLAHLDDAAVDELTEYLSEYLRTSEAPSDEVLAHVRELLQAYTDTREPSASSAKEPSSQINWRIGDPHTYPPRSGVLVTDSFQIKVNGTPSNVADFNKALFDRFSELALIQPTIGRSESTLELTFRSPVPADDITRVIREVANLTGVTMESVGYSPTDTQ